MRPHFNAGLLVAPFLVLAAVRGRPLLFRTGRQWLWVLVLGGLFLWLRRQWAGRRSELDATISGGLDPAGGHHDPATSSTGAANPADIDRVVIACGDFADWPLLAQLSQLGIRFHMGYLFGLANQLLFAGLALGLLSVILWGYRMWWQRRPTRADRRAPLGSPPARGTWRQVRPATLITGIVLAAAVGWALPELGACLLAFLALDLLVATIRRRRTRRSAPTSPAPASR